MNMGILACRCVDISVLVIYVGGLHNRRNGDDDLVEFLCGQRFQVWGSWGGRRRHIPDNYLLHVSRYEYVQNSNLHASIPRRWEGGYPHHTPPFPKSIPLPSW
jgi:hypothetical protein